MAATRKSYDETRLLRCSVKECGRAIDRMKNKSGLCEYHCRKQSAKRYMDKNRDIINAKRRKKSDGRRNKNDKNEGKKRIE